MDIEKQVQKAADLIAQLREVDTDFRVFGAQSHRYRIGPPLAEDELRAFETRHEIELPPDYRLYLKTIGNGNGDLSSRSSHEWSYTKAGAGPHYGIYRLEDTPMGMRTKDPFPFEYATEVAPDLSALWNGDIPGLLKVGIEGCVDTSHLVVSGTTYGIVWVASEYAHLAPTWLSFIEWITEWAKRCIPLVMREKVVNPVEEGMSLQEVVSVCDQNGLCLHSLKTPSVHAENRVLKFKGLRTEFEVDDQDVVVRITKHSI